MTLSRPRGAYEIHIVAPAKAGAQYACRWMPAFAGMTKNVEMVDG
jgi:hypothetical protein